MITEQDLNDFLSNEGHWINLEFLSPHVMSVTQTVDCGGALKRAKITRAHYTTGKYNPEKGQSDMIRVPDMWEFVTDQVA